MYQTAFDPYDQLFVDFLDVHQKSNMKVQHYHDSYEIYLQTGGERYLFLDETCYYLQPGDLYILKPFTLHYTESKELNYYQRYVMNFKEDYLDELLSASEKALLLGRLNTGIFHLSKEQTAFMETQLKLLRSFCINHGFLAERTRQAGLLCLLSSLSDLLKEQQIAKQLSNAPNIQPEIIQAIHYMNQHYMEDLNLDTTALAVHMSKYHFCRMFHQTTGATFLDYLYNIRLTKVHQMLLNSSLSLSDIAQRTGFTSTAHLSRHFSAVYGMSPREFRANHKSGSSGT